MNSAAQRAAAKAKRKGATSTAERRVDSGKKRYAATQERGESTYKKEWSHFISGVEVAELGARIEIDSEKDHAESAGKATFSYLFGGKEKAKPNKAKERGNTERQDKQEVTEGPSRMEKLVSRAAKKGISLEGLNRKERRALLEAQKTDSQLKKEERAAKEAEEGLPPRPKPHELMDKKLAWYQQGPHPLDEISERLVLKKALKHARQNGWKYNFEAPHPSWLAARARRRREGNLWATGQHIAFADGD
eukprot:CAMPEP_0174832460 /NCGR_PEP_ID=MMETSP1114-20130205/3688_1 /TAXON_ID=312471 /ORGANISM="Neobodo designis, Strain CCAP 1951/1" /LENGTH=247 /DNA_ID=CAMNT_0016066319 /DNA_START=29 /DNA_END=769 /DNA_ORIENTATION=+